MRSNIRLLLWAAKHEFFSRLELIGMRDRLRCPQCKKVGTWKPHEGPRRWLCKWCGWYDDGSKTGWCRPCRKKKVWMLRPLRKGLRPCEKIRAVDPWRG